jgi:hypothetical protein
MSTGRWVVAIILILIGVTALIGNFDLVDWDQLADVWRLWPLLLVILGISLFFGTKRRGLSLVLIIIVVVFGAALAVAILINADDSVAEDSFRGPPVQGIQSATIFGDLGALDLSIQGQPSDVIVEADYRVRGELTVADTGPDPNYEVEFSQETRSYIFPFLGGDGDQFVDLRLAAGVPWDIDINVGAASANIDLEQVTLSSMELDAGASSLDLHLGENVEDGAQVNIDGGAGSFDITVPRTLTVRVVTETGLSSQDFDDEFREVGDDTYVYDGGGPEVTIRIRAGASSLNVDLD